MMNRALAKRKSETDMRLDGTAPPQHKRILTEKIAAGMGILRLSDSPDAQGNARPAFMRTTSTPSNFQYAPSFTPARPDLVSSFELTRPYQPQAMDEDTEMACSPQLCKTAQPPSAPSIYSQPLAARHIISNAPTPNTLVALSQASLPVLHPISEDNENEPKLKMVIPLSCPPPLEPSLLHSIVNPDSRALILYSSPKDVIEESLRKGTQKQEQTAGETPRPTTDDVMMLD
jgi:hypothetical protein